MDATTQNLYNAHDLRDARRDLNDTLRRLRAMEAERDALRARLDFFAGRLPGSPR